MAGELRPGDRLGSAVLDTVPVGISYKGSGSAPWPPDNPTIAFGTSKPTMQRSRLTRSCSQHRELSIGPSPPISCSAARLADDPGRIEGMSLTNQLLIAVIGVVCVKFSNFDHS